MINRVDSEAAVRPFEREVLQRLPLADAVLSLWAFVMDPTFLDGVFQRHRGRSFEQELKFPVFVELIADAGATSRKRAAVLRAGAGTPDAPHQCLGNVSQVESRAVVAQRGILGRQHRAPAGFAISRNPRC